MGTLRKILMAVVLVGALATATGSGTFATFNATTTNVATTFETGTLVLSNLTDKASAATCYSTGMASGSGSFSNGNTQGCDALFTTIGANLKPGAATLVTKVTLKNEGDLTASALKVFASTPCTSAIDAITGFHGNGDLCSSATGALRISIQQTDVNFTANTACIYPVGAGACASPPAGVLASLPSTQAGGLTAGAGTMAPNDIRYYKVSLNFADSGVSGTENAMMGKKADFGLSWVMEQ
jgi:hypothetical protein